MGPAVKLFNSAKIKERILSYHVFFCEKTRTAFKNLIIFCNLGIGSKSECYITLGWKDLPDSNTLANRVHMLVTKKMKCCNMTSGAILTALHLLVAYKWVQYVRVLIYTGMERLTDSNTLANWTPYVSYEENEML